MWDRKREAFSTYKRLSLKDNSNSIDMEDNSAHLQNGKDFEASNPSWSLSLPHVLVATLTSFLFGYHLGVVNEPLEIISADLGFNGNTMAEGLVVSTCLGGALIGSLLSGWVADGVGRRRAFQLSALPMILGAGMSAMTKTLAGMLLGRLFVGTGMGLGPPVASLYVTEVSPAFVRGTYGSFIQIATCLGLMAALLIGIPVKEIADWWRTCFWVSTIPAALLALAMVFCAESPHWLYKQGRTEEAETEFEKLLGGSHVKSALAELSKFDRGDEPDDVKLSELLFGRHFQGCSNGTPSSCRKLSFLRLRSSIFVSWWHIDVCLDVCSWSWSGSRSSFTRNFPKSDKGKSYGDLHVGALGDKFFRRIALPTTIGENGASASVLWFCYILLDCSCIREKECGGNQRKITSRN
ncbi:probable plastidic glucose transporter 2 isoform X3 [Cucumis melo]|uniref:Probable plastidic glucose transporter 2 isoform X3 n=1 Tax=Cucumis melo TaxID=3656 RepID=A0A1S3CJ84_CUCME|nr:probable plastidic glucose transporter 2 isoform X3 [Cucumis melo]